MSEMAVSWVCNVDTTGLTGLDIERIEGSGTAGTSAVVVPVAAQAVAAQAVADSETGGVHV